MAAEGGLSRRKKRRARPAEEPGAEADADAEAANSVEARLAAFGEAFLESIEGASSKRQRPRAGAVSVSAAVEEAPLAGSASSAAADIDGLPKRKRKKAKNAVLPTSAAPATAATVAALAANSTSAAGARNGAVAEMPRAPGRPKAADRGVGSPGQPQAATPSGGGAASSSRPPRMTAAEKRRFMSGKVADIRSSAKKPEPGRRERGGDPEEDEEFKKTLREVLEFVTPQLGKQERKQYEDAKIRALGGTVDARQKMPYWKLKQDLKFRETKRTKILAEEKLGGVSMSANQHRTGSEVDKLLKKKKEMLKDKKRRREDTMLHLGMGARENRGMASIPKAAIRSYNRRQ